MRPSARRASIPVTLECSAVPQRGSAVFSLRIHPYHFVYDAAYDSPTTSESIPHNPKQKQSVTERTTPIVAPGTPSDASVMSMLKGRCKRFHPDYLVEGARRDGVYWYGTQAAKAGVDYLFGLEYVKKLYQSDEVTLIRGGAFTEDENELFKKLEKEYNEGIANKSISNIDEIIKNKEIINGNNIIIVITENYEVPILKQLVDNITNSLENTFVLLANKNKENVNIISKTNINSNNIHCGNIVREICQKCQGNGGGNQFFAQGGGSNAKDLSNHLAALKEQLKQ
mgnify:CR=1 FL=1